MDISEAMDTVMKDERALQEKYAKLAEQEKDPFVKVFLNRIVKDAMKHEKKVWKKHEKILATLKKRTF